MFGWWANCLINQPTLQTPLHFLRALSAQFPDTIFVIMQSCRDWKDYFNAALVRISGIGNSTGAAHSFTFMKRRDYHIDTHGQPTSAFSDSASPDDVLMLPRKYIHSSDLCQPPLVAMPAGRIDRLRSQAAPRILPRNVYSKDQRDGLLASASKLDEFPFHLTEAAEYLRQLAGGHVPLDTSSTRLDVAPLPTILFPTSLPTAISKFEPPINLIEPPDAVKLITAKAVRDKAMLETKRKRGRGKLSTETADAAPPLSMVDVADVGVDCVDEHGDIVERSGA